MSSINSSTFPANSRYHDSETATLELKQDKNKLINSKVDLNSKEIIYLKRRFLPDENRLSLMQEHEVVAGDRLDNITAMYLSDPVLFWRICDANKTMKPQDLLVELGRKIRINLPEGIPEISNAPG